MQRMTRQRLAVSEVLAEIPEFVSAQQLHEELAERGVAVGLATVYRTLQTLAAAGEVDVLRLADGEAAYRRCATRDHHHHLVCRACGTTVEIDGPTVEAWAGLVGDSHGFTRIEHTIELFGLCAECSSEDALDAAVEDGPARSDGDR
ncbi:Fur family transcriptional regulator [Sanguibacter sp. HDW7]|uniref:Fur family transcriptional regulator n=1 Tax=Sanguibacter sp. HDW7 TaxID=2714931 RepID=UPI001409E296|nr:Fur family transcriptional regulator [Sanguibacter sp. HDW7]QIK83801.1 transcriptional repressor [Sanguibacter sp. HDW7]